METCWKKNLGRIATHFFEIFEDIYLYFLEPAPKMSDQLEEQLAKFDKMDFGMEREKLMSGIFVEFYASQEPDNAWKW